MPNRFRPLALLVLATGLLSLGSAHAATILYSNDVLGEVEPCGCRVDPMGGIVRRSGLMKRLESEKKGPFVQLDSGNLLFESKEFPEVLVESRRIQAAALVKAHEQMGLDATVPGDKDFALGIPVYQALLGQSKIRVLAANLTQNGKPLFPGSMVVERTGAEGKPIRIGVIGLIGENLVYPEPLKIEPRLAAFEREKAALEGKTDLLVVLSHAGMESDLELVKKLKGVAHVIGANSQSFTQDPVVENSIPIVQSSYRNQYVGVIPIESIAKPETFRLEGLDESYEKKSDPAVRAILKQMQKELAKEKKRILKLKN